MDGDAGAEQAPMVVTTAWLVRVWALGSLSLSEEEASRMACCRAWQPDTQPAVYRQMPFCCALDY